MTFVELNKTNFDNTRIKVFPQQNYVSGSSLCLNTSIGEYGCVPAVRTRSKSIKEFDNNSNLKSTINGYEEIEENKKRNRGTHQQRNPSLNYLLSQIIGQGEVINKSQSDNYFFKIKRSTLTHRRPEASTDLLGIELADDNKNQTYNKNIVIKNNLYNKYKKISSRAESYNRGFCNYNTLNFFTLGAHPDHIADGTTEKKTHKTCVVYPNPNNNTYTPSSMTGNEAEYTISFWLNPRRTNVNGYAYNPGTIISIPGLINVYLVKGTSLDEFGYTDKFRLLLDTNVASYRDPTVSLLSNSSATVSNFTSIVTDDNLLDKNKWYHISIVRKNSLIRLYVDGESVLDDADDIENMSSISSTISPIIYIGNKHDYNSTSDWTTNYSDLYDYYFGSDAALEFSSFDNGNATGREDAIASFGGTLPDFEDGLDVSTSDSLALNAELADIRIYSSARLQQQVLLDMKNYVDSLTNELHLDLVFYVPIYFIPELRKRKIDVIYGTKETLTIDGPVNPYLSHRVLGHEVSVEHFLNEFVQKSRPFIEGVGSADLEGTTADAVINVDETIQQKINKSFLSDVATKTLRQNNHILRNHLLLPNDNGKTLPSWKLIDEVYPDAKTFVFYKDIFGNHVKGLVSVNEIVDISKIENTSGLFSIGPRISNFPNGSLYRKNRKPDSDNLKEKISLTGNINPDNEDINSILASLTLNSSLMRTPSILQSASPINVYSYNNFSLLERRILVLYEMTSYLGETYSPIFEIPNAFYNEKVREETIELEDRDIAGTAGALQIKLKDNQSGGMYRADCLTPHAKWNYVGNVFRNEGFISLLHPSLASFGELSFDIKFKGEHGLNVFEINVPCEAGEHNVSINSSYKKIKPTDYNADHNADFVFIDTINLHDENLNIVAKANLSQPLSKRITDKYNFRLKLDY
jgi:hypothetical protein